MPEIEPMDLIYSLIGYPAETEWIEFKRNNSNPEQIAKDISALSNAAAYLGRDCAYKVWGVDDDTHQLIGTTFNPLDCKVKGNQLLPIWLKQVLSPNANYDFKSIQHDGLSFAVLTCHAPVEQPVYYDGKAYIREGSSTTPLIAGSAREKELWRRLQRSDYESRIAAADLSKDEVADLLDIEAYFRLLEETQPTNAGSAMTPLCEQGLLKRQDNGGYAITNLGMLLVARRLSAFQGARHHMLRVIRFAGTANIDILDSRDFDCGYGLALPEAEGYIMSLVPSEDRLEGAFRRIHHAFPRAAVRELLSNVVIHQDLTIADSGPLVSIYDNRIDFSNPGATLIPPLRLLNAQPKTRNKELVTFLRHMHLCEEGGTGVDRAVAACEQEHMLPPQITSSEESGTRVTLYAGSGYNHMRKQQRMDAAYWHACLLYAQGESMSNQSLRTRFGLPDDKRSLVAVSRLIKECCGAGLLKDEDPDAGSRYRRYIPAWA